MTSVTRRAVFFAVLGLTTAVAVAGAVGPDPCLRCTFPAYVDLGGCDGSGQPDATISFSVTLRDLGNFPIANQLVRCTFNNDVRIYDTVPGGFVYCPCIEASTDLNGVATYHVPGAGRNTSGGASFTGASSATFAVGNCGSAMQTLATAHVTTYDENGGVTTKGVEITDLSAWVADYNARAVPPTRYRSDFNHGGAVDIADLSYWVRVYNAGQSGFACGTFCP